MQRKNNQIFFSTCITMFLIPFLDTVINPGRNFRIALNSESFVHTYWNVRRTYNTKLYICIPVIYECEM